MPNQDPDLRFYVDGSLTATDILNQIKNLYPKVKEEKDSVLIEIIIDKDVNPAIIQEIGTLVTESEILEFRDSLVFRNK